MAETLEKKILRKAVPEQVRSIVESVFACKWSLTILLVIDGGTCRPGAIVRAIEGLSPKVMNQCLVKLIEFAILEKQAFPEIPPRVEYAITPFGRRFMGLFTLIDQLAEDLATHVGNP